MYLPRPSAAHARLRGPAALGRSRLQTTNQVVACRDGVEDVRDGAVAASWDPTAPTLDEVAPGVMREGAQQAPKCAARGHTKRSVDIWRASVGHSGRCPRRQPAASAIDGTMRRSAGRNGRQTLATPPDCQAPRGAAIRGWPAFASASRRLALSAPSCPALARPKFEWSRSQLVAKKRNWRVEVWDEKAVGDSW